MAPREAATVLVVDDEPDVADAYAVQLSDRHDVVTAYSGEEALEELDEDIDVVLLDRRMPDISGDDVLARIRERDLGARVAMVTAVDPDFDIIDMPFDDYVVKPVSRDDLFETIDRLLACADYESLLREYYALSSKQAALRAAKTEAELETHDEFQRLERELEQRREDLEEVVSSFDESNFEIVFGDFDRAEHMPTEGD